MPYDNKRSWTFHVVLPGAPDLSIILMSSSNESNPVGFVPLLTNSGSAHEYTLPSKTSFPCIQVEIRILWPGKVIQVRVQLCGKWWYPCERFDQLNSSARSVSIPVCGGVCICACFLSRHWHIDGLVTRLTGSRRSPNNRQAQQGEYQHFSKPGEHGWCYGQSEGSLDNPD